MNLFKPRNRIASEDELRERVSDLEAVIAQLWVMLPEHREMISEKVNDCLRPKADRVPGVPLPAGACGIQWGGGDIAHSCTLEKGHVTKCWWPGQ